MINFGNNFVTFLKNVFTKHLLLFLFIYFLISAKVQSSTQVQLSSQSEQVPTQKTLNQLFVVTIFAKKAPS